MSFKSFLEACKKGFDFLWKDDSMLSFVLFIGVAIILIKFLVFPFFGFVLNNDYPVVAIVSQSMEHGVYEGMICGYGFSDVKFKGLSSEEYWFFCGGYYEKVLNISRAEFESFRFAKGLNVGDVMILYGKDVADIEVGEILVFKPKDRSFFENYGPVIHRVVAKWQDDSGEWHFKTKGDHNPASDVTKEIDIPEGDVFGVAVFRIPFIGFVKIYATKVLMFFVGMF